MTQIEAVEGTDRSWEDLPLIGEEEEGVARLETPTICLPKDPPMRVRGLEWVN
jgi:hypothetical protein